VVGRIAQEQEVTGLLARARFTGLLLFGGRARNADSGRGQAVRRQSAAVIALTAGTAWTVATPHIGTAIGGDFLRARNGGGTAVGNVGDRRHIVSPRGQQGGLLIGGRIGPHASVGNGNNGQQARSQAGDKPTPDDGNSGNANPYKPIDWAKQGQREGQRAAAAGQALGKEIKVDGESTGEAATAAAESGAMQAMGKRLDELKEENERLKAELAKYKSDSPSP